MQPFDDDIGELFLKASEDIRLSAATDDWDKIQKKLLPDISSFPISQTWIIKRRNLSLGISLLIILIISGTLFISGTDVFLFNKTARIIRPENKPGNQLTGKPTKKLSGEHYQALSFSKTQQVLTSQNTIEIKKVISQNKIELQFANLIAFPVPDLPSENTHLKLNISQEDGFYEKKLNKITNAKIYIGAIAGPQFSRTKQQGFGDVGLSAGLIAGYHLNNNLAVESGFVISNKQYLSAGKYFDMNKISAAMPRGMKLIQVQSKSTVFEIPVNIKYDIFKNRQSNAFVTTGVSSYILTSEINQYNASVNGNSETMNGHYSTHEDYFAAALNLSAGYECYARKNVKLRIEPYLQIPLKSIGMGSMHVVSAGIYLGIVIPVAK